MATEKAMEMLMVGLASTWVVIQGSQAVLTLAAALQSTVSAARSTEKQDMQEGNMAQ